jgi:hypothetical protein
MGHLPRETSSTTEAAIQFIDCPPVVNSRPRFYAGILRSEDDTVETQPSLKTVAHVKMNDLRGLENTLDINQHGLQILHLDGFTSLKLGSDRSEIIGYLTSITEEVKKLLGAELVVCYDYKFRRNDPAVKENRLENTMRNDRSLHNPVSDNAHVDATVNGAPRRIQRYLLEKEARQYLDKPSTYRARIINAWRPVSRPVVDRPLALCDYFSTKPEDFVTVEHHPSSDHAGELYWLRHDENQRWYWFSDHQLDEVLLFLTYDSAPGMGPKCKVHRQVRQAAS